MVKDTTKNVAKKATQKAATEGKTSSFSAEERAAMRERAKEQKAGADKVEGDSAVRAKIAEMSKADRDLAKRLHEIIKANAPDLTPRLWYGQPAYARDGKVVCFFQPADKFKTRYGTLGFSDEANLDSGGMWPTAFGIGDLTAADEKKIGELVKKAVS